MAMQPGMPVTDATGTSADVAASTFGSRLSFSLSSILPGISLGYNKDGMHPGMDFGSIGAVTDIIGKGGALERGIKIALALEVVGDLPPQKKNDTRLPPKPPSLGG